ncbi:MAG: hypothetical protein AB7O59_14235 [Pirellulales bacterium]
MENPYQSPGQSEMSQRQAASDEPIRFSGRLTQNDYDKIRELDAGWTSKCFRVLLFVLPAVLSLLLAMNFAAQIRKHSLSGLLSRPLSFYMQPVVAVAVVAFVSGGWYWHRRKARMLSDQQVGPYAPQTFELNHAGV